MLTDRSHGEDDQHLYTRCVVGLYKLVGMYWCNSTKKNSRNDTCPDRRLVRKEVLCITRHVD